MTNVGDGSSTGESEPTVMWVLLSGANVKELRQLADGIVQRPSRKLRKQLIAATRDKPLLSVSPQMSSGRFAPVGATSEVLAALFVGDADGRRAAALDLANAARRELRRGVVRPEDALPAANVSRSRFTATSIRSVVRGGAPDSSRKRH